jgi:hypothetical protein
MSLLTSKQTGEGNVGSAKSSSELMQQESRFRRIFSAARHQIVRCTIALEAMPVKDSSFRSSAHARPDIGQPRFTKAPLAFSTPTLAALRETNA